MCRRHDDFLKENTLSISPERKQQLGRPRKTAGSYIAIVQSIELAATTCWLTLIILITGATPIQLWGEMIRQTFMRSQHGQERNGNISG